jgi:hypothetical protein
MKTSSSISVDLSRSGTLSALESLSRLTECMSKIRSASVYTSRAGVGIHPANGGTAGIQRMFQILAGMPNLRQITVDLNRPHHFAGNGDLSLQALAVLLKGARRLQSLQLHQLDLGKTSSAVEELTQLLPKLKHWRTIQIVNCIGPGIGSFVNLIAKHSSSIRTVRIVSTPLPPTALVQLTIRPQLQVLQLEDLPDVTECQIAQVAMNLEHPRCLLQELRLRSSLLTDAAGQALTDMLWANKSLEKLYLHLDSEALAQGIADCLAANTTLRQVDLRCYGDDEAVKQHVIQMALALRHNQTLRQLRLCLEVEPHEYQTDIVQAFQETLLHHNTSLGELRLDDGIQKYDLPSDFQLSLKLNRSGFAQLAASSQLNQVHMNQWIAALAMPDADVSTIYTILQSCPMLFSDTAVKDTLLEDISSSSTTNKPRFRLPFRFRSKDMCPVDNHNDCRSLVVDEGATKPQTKSHGQQGGRPKLPSLRRNMVTFLAPSA